MKWTGLSRADVERLRGTHGYNEIKELNHRSPFKILLGQIKSNFVIYLLLFGMFASFFIGKMITGYTLLIIIIIVIVTGFVQEYKAERAIQALKRMILPSSLVVRGGIDEEVPSRELVPGDIIILHGGERIPADCTVLEERELRVDESILTGESKEVKKSATHDTTNYAAEHIIFTGTFIVQGRCVAQVIKTGMQTEFGKISSMISAAEKTLPLQQKLNKIAEYMMVITLIVSSLAAFTMFIRNMPITSEVLVEVLLVVIAMVVAAVPEGMPVVLITTLAKGAHRMAKKNAIVNRMSVIEALGETTIICTDKTGTLTKGEMTVRKIMIDDIIIDVTGAGYETRGTFLRGNQRINLSKNKSFGQLLQASVLCNDARLRKDNEEYRVSGTGTEGALLVMAAKAGATCNSVKGERKDEIPFTSSRKMMSVLYEHPSGLAVYVKGAPELLLRRCTTTYRKGRVEPLSDPLRAGILAINRSMMRRGYRTLALATKATESSQRETFEEELVFIGLVAMEDSPRDDVKEALAICQGAGIRVKMMTGDSKETALTIAGEIGLVGEALDGDEIDRMTDDELGRQFSHVTIFARVHPEHKLRIVRILKQQGEIVTMTGDGVNDAPALKEAHVGVAMGRKGTDVARDVADLVLKDDHFSTIVNAVSEGRTIFSNIQKFTTYQLSISLAQITLIFAALLLGMPLPLIPLQILFMNLISDEVTALTLGFAPASFDVMQRPPRRNAQLLTRETLIMLFIAAGIMSIGTLGLFAFTYYELHWPIAVARTMALVTMVLFGTINAFNFRSLRSGLLQLPVMANKHLVYASLTALAMTLMIIYTPLRVFFETIPIPFVAWCIAAGVASTLAFAFDIIKMKKWLNGKHHRV